MSADPAGPAAAASPGGVPPPAAPEDTLAAYFPPSAPAAPGPPAPGPGGYPGGSAYSGGPSPGGGYAGGSYSGGGPGAGNAADVLAAGPDRPRRGRRTVVLAVAAVVVVAAGAGTGYAISRHHHGTSPAAAASAPASAGSATAAPAASSATIAPTATPTPALTPLGIVTLSQAAAQNPAAAGVQVFLNDYFTAINTHNYAGYRALLSSPLQANSTPQGFASGYGSTTDSAAKVIGISALSNGQTSVSVNFISHQSVAQSATGSTCTTWHITLFLTEAAVNYVQDAAPASYHPAFHSC